MIFTIKCIKNKFYYRNALAKKFYHKNASANDFFYKSQLGNGLLQPQVKTMELWHLEKNYTINLNNLS